MTKPEEQFLFSRSSRDLVKLSEEYPDLLKNLSKERPVLNAVFHGREKLEVELDAERRELMRMNECRLAAYMSAAEEWSKMWSTLSRKTAKLTLQDAHEYLVEKAEGILPFNVL